MKKNAPISDIGIDLLKSFEGFRPNATLLPNGIWVIGHGHTVTARKGTTVDKNDAEALLLWDMGQLEPKVKNLVFAPIDQAQMDGLLSLAFNIGMENFSNSDVIRFLNEGSVLQAASAFDIWHKAKISDRVMVVDALVRRRAAEKARFLDVKESGVFAPSALLRPVLGIEPSVEVQTKPSEPELPPESETLEVTIDLSRSAALGSIMTEDGQVIDGQDPSISDELSYVFSDDDPPEETEVKTKAEQEETGQTGSNFVKIEDVFGQRKPVGSIREVAEKISGRLSKVASLSEEGEELPPLEDNDVSQEAQALAPKTESEPVSEIDEGMFPPVNSPTTSFPYDGDAKLPPLPEGEEPEPPILIRELGSIEEQPFDQLEKRNTGIFTLMGIVGLVLIVGGVYEMQRSGFVETIWDMVKGPGLAGFGALLALVAAYSLIRNLFAKRSN